VPHRHLTKPQPSKARNGAPRGAVLGGISCRVRARARARGNLLSAGARSPAAPLRARARCGTAYRRRGVRGNYIEPDAALPGARDSPKSKNPQNGSTKMHTRGRQVPLC
jgi:hypothetical protein